MIGHNDNDNQKMMMDNQIYDWLLCDRKNDAQMGQMNLGGLPPM